MTRHPSPTVPLRPQLVPLLFVVALNVGCSPAGDLVAPRVSALSSAVAVLDQAGDYIRTPLDVGDWTYAADINNQGTVAGTVVSQTIGVPTQGFVWNAGSVTLIGTLGGSQSWVSAINDEGWVTGVSSSSETGEGQGHAFLWKPGLGMIDLGTLPGGSASWGEGVNRQGVVVGHAYNAVSLKAFKWTEATGMVELPSLSELGGAIAYDINDDGYIVGTADDEEGYSHAVLWHPDGTIEKLGTIGELTYLRAFAISNDGVVVGDYAAMHRYRGVVEPTVRPFRWTRGNGMERLGNEYDVGSAVDVSAAGALGSGNVFNCVWNFVGACHPITRAPGQNPVVAINDAGVVAGYMINPTTFQPNAVIWTRRADQK